MLTDPPSWAVRTKADEQAIAEGARWNAQKARAIVAFAEKFISPQYITGTFRLLLWQSRFLQSIVGWRWADGRRRFRVANLHVPKKQGKTLLISILALYELFCGDDPSPMVAACAASRENATQVFAELKHTIERNGWSPDHCHVINHLKRITVPSLNATLRTFASIGSRVHGEPCSLVLCDEVAQWGDPELYRAMRYNTDARQNGLVVCISTASWDTSHFYYASIYSKSKRILSGDDLDTTHYAEVYEADKSKDLEKDEDEWRKALPSMGTSFPIEQFRRDLQAAKSNLGEWLNFLRLKLNVWCSPDETAWLDVSDFERYTKDISDEELKDLRAVVGCDLSEAGHDPTSVAIVWELPDRNYHVKSWCWSTKAANEFRDKGTLPKFDEFIAAKSMTITDGDMVDRDLVMKHILDLCDKWQVEQVVFDPASAYVLGNDIENEGHKVSRMVQSARNFNSPMVEFARAWKEGRVSHDGSNWLRYCLQNVRVEVNKYSEIRPFKRKSPDHIDGAIATLLAFAPMVTASDLVEQGITWV